MVATMLWLANTEDLRHKCLGICSVCRNHNPVMSSSMTYQRVGNNNNRTDATCGAVKTYPSGAPEFTPGLVRFVLLNLSFSMQCFVDRCVSLFLWPLCCISFVALRLLITTLVSSHVCFYQICLLLNFTATIINTKIHPRQLQVTMVLSSQILTFIWLSNL